MSRGQRENRSDRLSVEWYSEQLVVVAAPEHFAAGAAADQRPDIGRNRYPGQSILLIHIKDYTNENGVPR